MLIVVPLPELIAEMSDHFSRYLAAGQTILCHLYTNNLTPAPTNVLGDFTELTTGAFPGYVAQTVAQSGTPYVNGAGNAVQIQSDLVFQPSSDPPTPITIYGAYFTLHPTAGPDTLLGAFRFDTAPVISSATQAVLVDCDFSCAPLTSPETQ